MRQLGNLFSVLALAVLSCGRQLAGPGPTAYNSPQSNASTSPRSSEMPSTNDRLAAIVEQVPGFGGYYFDPDGVLNIYLLDPTQGAAERARAVLAETFHGGGFASAKVRPVQGQYDYVQLNTWFKRLSGLVRGGREVSMLAVSGMKNRLTVGVVTARARRSTEQKIRKAGVPLEAINFEVTGVFRAQ